MPRRRSPRPPATCRRYAGAAQALRAIADTYPTPSLAAGAALAEGRAALLAGESERGHRGLHGGRGALVGARRALRGGQRAAGARGGPRARTATRRGRTRSGGGGDDVCGVRGGHLGRGTRPVCGAPPSAASARGAGRPKRCSGSSATTGWSASEEWIGAMVDLKGFRYLERMLAEPGREFHVSSDLRGARHRRGGSSSQGRWRWRGGSSDGLPVIDDQARAAYRRRLAEVDEDIEEAVLMNDPGRRPWPSATATSWSRSWPALSDSVGGSDSPTEVRSGPAPA